MKMKDPPFDKPTIFRTTHSTEIEIVTKFGNINHKNPKKWLVVKIDTKLISFTFHTKLSNFKRA